MHRILTLIALSLSLVFAAGASATPPDLSALGYSVRVDADPLGGGVYCPKYVVRGFGVDVLFRAYNGLTCNELATEESMRAFAAGHDERKLGFENPAAVTARSAVQAKGYAVATAYAGPSFLVTGGCQGSNTVDAAGLVSLASSLPPAADPCPPPPTPAEEPPPPQPGPTVEERVTALEQALDTLRVKVGTLQAATEAAWTALVNAWRDGLPGYEAALAARSAGMNALYGLG